MVATPLYLGNIWKVLLVDNMKNTGLNGYVYDLRADYDAIAVDDLWDIHKYLMKNRYDIKTFKFIKKVFLISMSFFSCNALKCVSMNSQEYKVRP